MTEVAEAWARLMRDGSVQTGFPAARAAPAARQAEPSGGLPWSRIVETLFWPLVVVVGAVLLLWAVQAARNRTWQWRRRAAPAPGQAAAPVPEAAPDQADEFGLARAGAYGAAAHARLLRCLGMIGARFPQTLRPAHTPREIAALALPPAWQQAVGGLVAPAERAVFAHREVGRAEWEACVAASATVLDAPRSGIS